MHTTKVALPKPLTRPHADVVWDRLAEHHQHLVRLLARLEAMGCQDSLIYRDVAAAELAMRSVALWFEEMAEDSPSGELMRERAVQACTWD